VQPHVTARHRNPLAPAISAQVHCAHASPAGGAACGATPGPSASTCKNYCDNNLAVCTSANGLLQWNSWDECTLACASWGGQGFYNVPQTLYTMPWGNNSLPCRKYHSWLAAQSASNAQTHCVHTGPLGGGGVCGTECEGVCSLIIQGCGAAIPMQQCIDSCTSNLTSSMNVATKEILLAKVPRKSTGCAAYYAIKALTNTTICSLFADTTMSWATDCEASGATFVHASWMMILAAILLALGFTS